MKHLSVAPDELAAGVERLQGEGKALQRALRMANDKLAVYEARALDRARHARGSPPGDCRGAARPRRGGVEGDGCGRGHRARSGRRRCSRRRRPRWSSWRAIAAAGLDAGAALKALVAQFGGKGGGKPDLAQGGGLNASSDALVTAARKLLGE